MTISNSTPSRGACGTTDLHTVAINCDFLLKEHFSALSKHQPPTPEESAWLAMYAFFTAQGNNPQCGGTLAGRCASATLLLRDYHTLSNPIQPR